MSAKGRKGDGKSGREKPRAEAAREPAAGRLPQGRAPEAAGSATDRALRAVMARQRAVLLSISDAVIVTDICGHVELLNPAAEKLTGWRDGVARGRPLDEVFPILDEGTRAGVENPVGRVLREGVVVGLADHTLLAARDGAERPIAGAGAPVRDENGATSGVVLVFRDQTAGRAARNSLEKSEQRFRESIRFLNEGFVSCTTGGVLLEHNLACNRILGFDEREDLRGTNLHAFWQDPEDRRRWIEELSACGVVRNCLIRARKRGGEPAVLLANGRRVAESDGNTRIEASFTDVTERMRAEEEKRRLEDQLAQGQRLEALGRLAGGVAHDFNNLLTSILGYADLALGRALEGSALRDDILEIKRAAERSADLVRRLLTFARQQTIAPRLLDLNERVGDLHRMLCRLVGEDIQTAWFPGPGLWRVRIDPSQVDQILTNLVANARDAIAGPGKITIETENVTIDPAYCATHAGFAAGDYVMLAVTDDGCGMTPEVVEHAFEPFFTTKGARGGTGLGLATVYGIVKQNGGFINVYSEPGCGATFKIYLPAAKNADHENEPVQHDARVCGGSETLLMVEDDEAVLKLGRRVLEGLGYTVLSARTPVEAIRIAAGHAGPVDLLITDVVLPEMNGKQLAERLRASRPGLRCLYISGYTANVIAHHGVLDAGIHFVQKPFTRETLALGVRAALAG